MIRLYYRTRRGAHVTQSWRSVPADLEIRLEKLCRRGCTARLQHDDDDEPCGGVHRHLDTGRFVWWLDPDAERPGGAS